MADAAGTRSSCSWVWCGRRSPGPRPDVACLVLSPCIGAARVPLLHAGVATGQQRRHDDVAVVLLGIGVGVVLVAVVETNFTSSRHGVEYGSYGPQSASRPSYSLLAGLNGEMPPPSIPNGSGAP